VSCTQRHHTALYSENRGVWERGFLLPSHAGRKPPACLASPHTPRAAVAASERVITRSA